MTPQPDAPSPLLGVLHLETFWARSVDARLGKAQIPSALQCIHDRVLLAGLGLAVEETAQHLFRDAPSLSEFEQWILSINGGAVSPLKIERINAVIRGEAPPLAQQKVMAEIDEAPPVLDASDLAFWDEQGYVIVRNAISPEAARASEELLWEHLQMDREDPETWNLSRQTKGIMVQFFHHPILERNRESLRVHKAFAQLWGASDLWVTTDRMSFNPPESCGRPFQGPRLHWDTSLTPPIPFGLQGLIYLTDTSPDQGAFSCVPGFHRTLESWLKSLPPGANPRQQDLDKLGPRSIAAGAGDLIIWHQALPHGSSPNRAARPRIVQYITMFPPIAEPDRSWR